MSLIAKDSGGDFAPAPPGTHMARCYEMIDLGTQVHPEFGASPKVYLRWELADEHMDNGEPYSIGKMYTVSLHSKANLRRDLEAWRGRPFTQEELAGFDLTKVLGAPCLLNVGQKAKADGGTTSVITAIMALPRGTKAPQQHNRSRSFSLDDPDWAVYEALPEWLHTRILQAQEIVSGEVQVPGGVDVPDNPRDRGPDHGDDIPF